jgi:hypothetical protein
VAPFLHAFLLKLNASLFFTVRATWHAHLIFLHLVVPTIFVEQYKLWISSLFNFLQAITTKRLFFTISKLTPLRYVTTEETSHSAAYILNRLAHGAISNGICTSILSVRRIWVLRLLFPFPDGRRRASQILCPLPNHSDGHTITLHEA